MGDDKVAEPAVAADPAPAVLLARDEVDPAVAVLTLNRPDTYNALTLELKTALLAAIRELETQVDVRALVLIGAGRAFCVGQDLKEHAAALEAGPAAAFATVEQHYNPIVSGLVDLAFPVVAAINGSCVGAGLGFALACDLRIAAAGAKFSTAFAGIGLTADSGLSATLAHAVGVARATDLLMLNESFTAEEAANWGLVRQVVPADELQSAALDLARRLAAGPTKAYVEIKRAVRRGAISALPDVLEAEWAAQTRLGATKDHQRAVADFLAKRTPTFTGS
ncbi:2-(1,2-epoxy-1,2-dihydrophenyl)acetyl-CoA isomerase [Pseudonocardia thermophila]|jgi:Enoyl-CoA hydratase/carnithine racemase|uniref:2-(1,2-epoxy-1,2-dihydrophenyl)acetyl-CoA isomerase n=1 Tax=Pseudonocardia thermophila TaxID=1848 RepID=A0A1M6U0J1_PSETH|nr:enoyl-CoA hydratase-related protein [Pseudonocardia thermophila]SHK62671.1 2-(1,2-epoxy-1,2-dihydrophenyl)acetyl-CoA isomerase [Pseudonocardia thermophila]